MLVVGTFVLALHGMVEFSPTDDHVANNTIFGNGLDCVPLQTPFQSDDSTSRTADVVDVTGYACHNICASTSSPVIDSFAQIQMIDLYGSDMA